MAGNVDLKGVREIYKNMGDGEILFFAKEEGSKLSADAYLILKKELSNRHIGKEITDEIDQQIILAYGIRQKRFEEDIHSDLFVSSLDYALQQKKTGSSRYDIYVGLIERGISEPYANYMINKLDEWAENLHRDAVSDLQAGIGILVLGFVVLYITLTIERFEISAVFILVVGAVRIISALDKKKKYRKIIDNIKLER